MVIYDLVMLYINNDYLKLVDFEYIEFYFIEKEIYSIFRMAYNSCLFINRDNVIIRYPNYNK